MDIKKYDIKLTMVGIDNIVNSILLLELNFCIRDVKHNSARLEIFISWGSLRANPSFADYFRPCIRKDFFQSAFKNPGEIVGVIKAGANSNLENDSHEKNNLVTDPASEEIRRELAGVLKARMVQAGEPEPEIVKA